jgi:hypothetical protein
MRLYKRRRGKLEMPEKRETEDKNPLPYIAEFVRVTVKWAILSPLNRVKVWINREGWKLVWKIMESSVKKTLERLEPIKKYIDFRNWMLNKIISYMTEDMGWVLTITHPKAEHLKSRWVALAFVNPQFVDLQTYKTDDGATAIKHIGLLPPQDHLTTEWHVTSDEQMEHILKQDRMKSSDEFITEVKQ